MGCRSCLTAAKVFFAVTAIVLQCVCSVVLKAVNSSELRQRASLVVERGALAPGNAVTSGRDEG